MKQKTRLEADSEGEPERVGMSLERHRYCLKYHME